MPILCCIFTRRQRSLRQLFFIRWGDSFARSAASARHHWVMLHRVSVASDVLQKPDIHTMMSAEIQCDAICIQAFALNQGCIGEFGWTSTM